MEAVIDSVKLDKMLGYAQAHLGRRVTSRELAGHADVSEQTISGIRAKRTTGSSRTAYALAAGFRALGVNATVEDLISRSTSPESSSR